MNPKFHFLVIVTFFCLVVLLLCSFIILCLFSSCYCFVLPLLNPSFQNLVFLFHIVFLALLLSHYSFHIVVLHALLLLPRCYYWHRSFCNVTLTLFLSCYSFCATILELHLCTTPFMLQLCVAFITLQLLFQCCSSCKTLFVLQLCVVLLTLQLLS